MQLGVDAFNTIQVRVEDDGPPSQPDADTFRVSVSTLTAPVALSAIAWSGGELSFNITGPLGPDYVVQVSTDLATWTGLSTNTPSVMPFRFTDTDSGGSRCRFYRVLLGP